MCFLSASNMNLYKKVTLSFHISNYLKSRKKKKLEVSFLCIVSLTLGHTLVGPRQAKLVLIAYMYASSEGSGEPAHPRSLARTSAARSYKK